VTAVFPFWPGGYSVKCLIWQTLTEDDHVPKRQDATL
jgi:hypothetical protein